MECSECHRKVPKDQYTAAQLKKKGSRRCKDCVAGVAPTSNETETNPEPNTAAPPVASPAGPGHAISFVWPGSEGGASIEIEGSFTNEPWKDRIRLQPVANGKGHVAVVPLTEGEHHYKFIVDGAAALCKHASADRTITLEGRGDVHYVRVPAGVPFKEEELPVLEDLKPVLDSLDYLDVDGLTEAEDTVDRLHDALTEAREAREKLRGQQAALLA